MFNAGTDREPGPLALHSETVRPEWIDYNGHMNVAYYVLVFDHATDAVLDHLDLGEAYRQRSGCSVFVAEAHVTYEQEVNENERLWVSSRILGFDGKRIILFHEMCKGLAANDRHMLVASNEVLCLHVSLSSRRAAPFSSETIKRLQAIMNEHAGLPRPVRAGRAIALETRRPSSPG